MYVLVWSVVPCAVHFSALLCGGFPQHIPSIDTKQALCTVFCLTGDFPTSSIGTYCYYCAYEVLRTRTLTINIYCRPLTAVVRNSIRGRLRATAFQPYDDIGPEDCSVATCNLVRYRYVAISDVGEVLFRTSC